MSPKLACFTRKGTAKVDKDKDTWGCWQSSPVRPHVSVFVCVLLLRETELGVIGH